MRAGELRHRVDFQRPALVQDSTTGELVAGWETVWEKVPASFKPFSARSLFAAQAAQSEASARVVIRYRAGVEPAMRIIFRGQPYVMKGPALADPDSGLEYLSIVVATGVRNG